MKEIDNQVALVTGAGSPSGIGFACARIIGLDGAIVALVSTTDRIFDRVSELKKLGIHAIGFVADLTKPDLINDIMGDIQAKFGRLDICINNAGMTVVGEEQLEAAVDDITLEDWHLSIERNLTTCFLVTRAVLPLMRAQKYGRIVNITSTSGPVQAFVGDAAYHAAKAGMWGYTRACALETAADGITVNAVAPGWIATNSQLESESKAGLLTPMKRSGTPDEVAYTIRFLADPQTSYITGQLLIVDGGNSVSEDRSWIP
jgi:3-oxoacyl-[acyl-carrier protein] reductase